jgi:hypothetical protein
MENWKAIILAAGMTVAISAGLTAGESHASLYDRLGGKTAIDAVVGDFVGRIWPMSA